MQLKPFPAQGGWYGNPKIPFSPRIKPGSSGRRWPGCGADPAPGHSPRRAPSPASSQNFAYPASATNEPPQNPSPPPTEAALHPTMPSGPDLCTASDWLTFTSEEAGFSIQYPDETHVENNDFGVVFWLKPGCYPNAKCAITNRITIRPLQNAQQLPIQDFIVQKYDLANTPPYPDSLEKYQETGYFIEIGDVKAFRVEAGVSLGLEPEIFIPNGDQVLWIYYSSAAIGGGPIPPCGKTLEILGEMLETIVLFPPTQ